MLRNSCAQRLSNLRNNNKQQNIDKVTSVCNQLTLTRGFFRRVPSLASRTKEFNERKLVGYSMQQMYNVVSDVGNYKQFVPFCKKSNLLYEKPGFLKADLVIGFPPIIESYVSNVTLVEPYLVRAMCIQGKLFNHLETTWKFSPALKNNPQTCIIDFYVSFEFRSLLHSNLAHIFFDKLVKQMEAAFITEAKVRYGKASIASRKLDIES